MSYSRILCISIRERAHLEAACPKDNGDCLIVCCVTNCWQREAVNLSIHNVSMGKSLLSLDAAGRAMSMRGWSCDELKQLIASAVRF